MRRSVIPPKHAMVLAAGLGTRMRPFNGSVPKPLVKVGNKALIDYVLDRLAAVGVERAVVNVHYLADQIERHLRAGSGRRFVFSRQSAASCWDRRRHRQCAAAAWRRAVLPGHSDAIWIDGVNFNLARLAPRSIPEPIDGLLLLAPTTSSIGYTGRGDFTMAPDGKLTRRGEREVVPFVYAGRRDPGAGVRGWRATGAVPRCRRCSTGRSKPDGFAGFASKASMMSGTPEAVPHRRRSRHRRQRGVAQSSKPRISVIAPEQPQRWSAPSPLEGEGWGGGVIPRSSGARCYPPPLSLPRKRGRGDAAPLPAPRCPTEKLCVARTTEPVVYDSAWRSPNSSPSRHRCRSCRRCSTRWRRAGW